jgi:Ca2+-binding RTX toxin-like protein
MLIAGAGNESLVGGSATGSLVLQGGSGNDIMTAGDGRTDFVVGTGDDSITDGGVADVVTITRGQAGGLDVINNFRVGIDALDLVGYSASSIGNTIASQISDGRGGSLLLLSDGTRVDLIGLPHVTSGIFT